MYDLTRYTKQNGGLSHRTTGTTVQNTQNAVVRGIVQNIANSNVVFDGYTNRVGGEITVEQRGNRIVVTQRYIERHEFW